MDEGKFLMADIEDYKDNKSKYVRINFVYEIINDNERLKGSIVIDKNIEKSVYNSFLNRETIKIEAPGYFKEEFKIYEYKIIAL